MNSKPLATYELLPVFRSGCIVTETRVPVPEVDAVVRGGVDPEPEQGTPGA